MHTVFIGASRGIGRFAALDLLASDESKTVTLLLRHLDTIRFDPDFAKNLASGRLRLVQGDAYDEASVRSLFDAANGDVDAVVFSLGATYRGGKRPFSLTKGFILPSLDVTTRAMLVLVRALADVPYAQSGTKVPRLVVVSAMGVGSSFAHLPYVMQAMIPWLLRATTDDKRGVEAILHRAASSPLLHTLTPSMPDPSVFTPSVLASVRASFVPEITVVRPARLEDCPAGGKGEVEVGEEVTVWSVTRNEVGQWIAQHGVRGEKWANRMVTIGH